MTRFFVSKQRREIWSRRIRGFWEEYSHNRIGLVGLLFVLIYVVVALTAPWVTPFDPIESRDIADGFAMPSWMTIFPQYKLLPRTMEPPISLNVEEADLSIQTVELSDGLVVQYYGEEEGIHSINLSSSFHYSYDAPDRISVAFDWAVKNVTDAGYLVEVYISNPVGKQFLLWTSYSAHPSRPFTTNERTLISVKIYSDGLTPYVREQLDVTALETLTRQIFLQTGTYKLEIRMKFRSMSIGTAEIHLRRAAFKVYGRVHGILGTDSLGRDIFTQLIYGARISLAVGLLSAFLSTSIGISVGIIAGYVGGAADETLMRIVDILLCLPVLPLLLALIVLYGTSVWYLVVIIALFGWLGLSRLIRSQVLSLKEMPFIECAKAAGAGKFYIMLKHMVPNVLPVALAALILSIPAAILTEAAISFIGLGDPSSPTWGRMLHYAFGMGGFWHLAWWWIIPPGLAITVLTVSFVFIGHAVDEIVNPRLRRRR